MSKTYSVVTPESVEHGDYDRHGWVFEDTDTRSLRDVKRELEQIGASDLNLFPNGTANVYGYDSDTDYRTGEVTSYALHFKFETPAEERAFRKVWARWFK